ncbi:MAG: NAD-dependent epimerase/dehydratase family protein [Planctomycetota bacterium]
MKAFVTGGGGFLGLAIVRELCARGDEVVSFSRSKNRQLDVLGAQHVTGDLTDGTSLAHAMKGADTVFHVAAKAGIWGAREEYERTNVAGTRHVVDACRANGVQRLVFTSSPSVCFDGRDHVNASNDLPYPTKFLAHYPASKAEAERLVLAANDRDGEQGLATCALRPHLIIGPGDPHLLPRLIARARARRLVIIGRGDNEVSLTYIDNAAHAHVCAADRLEPRAPHAGQAYFVTQQEPVQLWTWVNALLGELGIAPVTKRVSLPVAYAAGALCEAAWTWSRREGEPPMTRFLALQLARSHTYDMTSAKRDFAYVERVGMPEATARVVAAMRSAHLAAART